MTDVPRSLEVRLTEYRDSLVTLSVKLDQLRLRTGDPVRLYNVIAEELTHVIAGEELETVLDPEHRP
jgi:hypothetical protein